MIESQAENPFCFCLFLKVGLVAIDAIFNAIFNAVLHCNCCKNSLKMKDQCFCHQKIFLVLFLRSNSFLPIIIMSNLVYMKFLLYESEMGEYGLHFYLFVQWKKIRTFILVLIASFSFAIKTKQKSCWIVV